MLDDQPASAGALDDRREVAVECNLGLSLDCPAGPALTQGGSILVRIDVQEAGGKSHETGSPLGAAGVNLSASQAARSAGGARKSTRAPRAQEFPPPSSTPPGHRLPRGGR